MLKNEFVMKRCLKTAVFTAVSVVLFYYNIAWAVLRCPHQENHSDLGVVVYDSATHAAEIAFAHPDRNQANLDCTGPKYHTESLAGSSGMSEILRLAGGVASHTNLLPALPIVGKSPAQEIRLKAFLVKGLSPDIDLPQYLSFLVLRL
jgi:hypothetical protein